MFFFALDVEGHPVFLPARSMSQADYVETLKTLIKFLGDKKKRKKILKENSVVKIGGGSGHTVRQYPLHTKRVDMLMVRKKELNKIDFNYFLGLDSEFLL